MNKDADMYAAHPAWLQIVIALSLSLLLLVACLFSGMMRRHHEAQ